MWESRKIFANKTDIKHLNTVFYIGYMKCIFECDNFVKQQVYVFKTIKKSIKKIKRSPVL